LSYRAKLALFIVVTVAVLFLFDTAYQGLTTLSQLDGVEAERDNWQRPNEVIRALDLKPGSTVVDLGCGSGYFSLKLSAAVGQGGRVLAEDIRRLPLEFLWIRTLQRGEHNVQIFLGEPGDPHLPAQGANAVLIANTYHEFTDSHSILSHLFQSLISGGRLVVVDREQHLPGTGSTGTAAEHHEVSADQVANELRREGFEIIALQIHFIDSDPSHETWWMITARKP
jgi:arsenite methyltransferase